MKILHYILGSPDEFGGGLMKYAIDLGKVQNEKGHMITFAWPYYNSTIINKTCIIKENSFLFKGSTSYRFESKVPLSIFGVTDCKNSMSDGDYDEYYDFFMRSKIEILHIHTLLGIEKNLFLSAKKLGIKIVFTTHDFFGVCPKFNLFSEGERCHSIEWNNCNKCCTQSVGNSVANKSNIIEKIRKNKIISKVLRIDFIARFATFSIQEIDNKRKKKIEPIIDKLEYFELKKYYYELLDEIDLAIFNSNQTKEIYSKRYVFRNNKVIPISHCNIRDNRKERKYKRNELNIAYLGNTMDYKGFDLLKKTLDQVIESGRKNIRLHVYFNIRQKNDKYITYNEGYQQEKIKEVLEGKDIVVVPSLCWETFGFVVLEAISCGIPCIITNTVGAKDILIENNLVKLIVNANIEELSKCLNDMYDNKEILEELNYLILKIPFTFSMENHVDEIIENYNKLLEKDKL